MLLKFDDKKIKNKKIEILLCGSGRWSHNICKEIYNNFHSQSKIFFYTKNKKNLLLWLNKNKYLNFKFLEKIPNANKKCNYAIVANKNKNHYETTEILLRKNFNILVEKPLICSDAKINYLRKLSKYKKKIVIISMQFFYSKSFLEIKNRIKKDKIKILKIDWLDKEREIDDKILKKHDYSIRFIEDVYYHLYSIITLFLENNLSLEDSKILKIEYNKIIVVMNNVIIKCFFCRNSKSKKRLITILTKLNNKIIINFKDYKSTLISKNGQKIPIITNFTLKYQIYNFVNNNFYKKPLINDIRNLSIFFKNLELIKNNEKDNYFNTGS